jgi:hypothetical protein
MASTIVQVADAVLATVKGLSFDFPYTANRGYGDIDEQLEERDKAQIDVIPSAQPLLEQATRGAWAYRVDVHVVLRQRFSALERALQDGRFDNAILDPMVEAVERIAEALTPVRFTSIEPIDAKFFQSAIESLYISEHLRQFGQFTGHIRVTFMVEKLFP